MRKIIAILLLGFVTLGYGGYNSFGSKFSEHFGLNAKNLADDLVSIQIQPHRDNPFAHLPQR